MKRFEGFALWHDAIISWRTGHSPEARQVAGAIRPVESSDAPDRLALDQVRRQRHPTGVAARRRTDRDERPSSRAVFVQNEWRHAVSKLGKYGEPWRANDIETTDGKCWCTSISIAENNSSEVSERIQAGCSKRIVLCVNACTGIPDERLAAIRPGDIAFLLDQHLVEAVIGYPKCLPGWPEV